MGNINFNWYKLIFLSVLITHFATAKCQTTIDSLHTADFQRLESNINKKESLEQTRLELESLKKHKNDIVFARSVYDLMKIKDQRTEDTLHFRNSAFIDTLLHGNITPKLKAILYLMRARRISSFDSRPLKFNAAAYRTNGLAPDYAAFKPVERDSIAAADLYSALQFHDQKLNGDQLLWLSSNPDVFLFNPGFLDIVLAERVNQLAANGYYMLEQKKSYTDWLPLTSGAFRGKLDSLAATAKNSKDILVAYQRWISLHKPDPAVSAFIESLIRKNIYLSAPADSVTKQHYIQYLQTGVTSPYPAFKAHSVYQLCLIFNEEGNKYASFGDRLSYRPIPAFDPQYQFYPAKALQLYQQNQDLMNKYPLFNKVLDLMSRQIKADGVRIEMEDKHLPGQPIPIKVIYRNADTLFYRIIPTWSAAPPEKEKVPASKQLLDRRMAAAGDFALPLPADHNRHAVYLKLGQLPAGHYRLLFSSKPIQADGPDLNNIAFEVSSITAINSDQHILVLDRKTGFPLAGAKIKAYKLKKPVQNRVPATVGADGVLNIAEHLADSINITFKGDTTGYKFSVSSHEPPNEIYNKANYDNLTEFYDDKLRMEIFTDRGIYRPGQTVHYKIIFLTNDPDTGVPILFNNQNIGGSILKKWLDDGNGKINLKDPFGKKTDSASININDFGSFAGSFVIPKTAATGRWQIDGPPQSNYRNDGSFKVEEYKRPAIELAMEKQKKMLVPGEPFAIKLKLRSFNGSDLANIPVDYTISRSGRVPLGKKRTGSNIYDYSSVELIHQTGHTDEKGELTIPVSDTVLAKAALNDTQEWNFSYYITATGVDATGERTTLNENLRITSRPVKINIPLDQTYDRQALPILNVSTTVDNEGSAGRSVNIRLYKVNNPGQSQHVPKYVDQWYYKPTDWNTWFPDKAVTIAVKEEKVLILDTVINTAADKKLVLGKERMETGFYSLLAESKENGRIIGQSGYSFNVFDSKTVAIPASDVDYTPVGNVKPGDWITWYSSAKNDNYTLYQVLYVAGNTKRVISNSYETVAEKAGLRLWKYQVPATATGQVLVNRITVRDNKIEKHQRQIYINTSSIDPPEIIVEKYRKVMAPGASETFTLSVKTKKDNTAAELMTTLYDASLDKLQGHHWTPPDINPQPYYLHTNWNYTLTKIQKAGNYSEQSGPVFDQPQFWSGGPGAVSPMLQGRIAGINIGDASGLNEVVVVGYGTPRKLDLSSSSTIMIRGSTGLQDYVQPLTVIDGEVFTGDLKSLDVATVTGLVILKGADATAAYGARAAQGVLVISTKGPIVLPASDEPVIKIRKDFNETAFFMPQVYAGTDGFYTFSFTMPETATEWNWKILAHTRKTQFAYLEKKLQTQLSLMVQPNMPRLLYQGDKIKLQSRITNLDSLVIQGKVTCKIEDAVTGEDLTAALTASNSQPFKLDKKSTGAVAFSLHVPSHQSNPLKIVIAAISGSSADAEEHIIPVLSTRVFTSQSQPVHFSGQSTLSIQPVKLPADATLYGMGISIPRKPQASLVYALPWLANYAYDCAEQTFNKLRAQVTALKLMQTDTTAQSAFKKATNAVGQNKTTDAQLPDKLADETMPWLGISKQADRQQNQLFHLLDTSVTKRTIESHLDKLQQLQQPDGGLSWFEGGKSNAYISAYVIAGFGQLKQMGWTPERGRTRKQAAFISSLLNYQQGLLNPAEVGTSPLFQLYALSYWIKEGALSAQLSQKINTLLNSEWKNITDKNLEQQTLLIISTLRFTPTGNELNMKAQNQLENIRQLAISDQLNGLRWKAIADAGQLSSSAEETMALLAEAFGLSTKYAEIQPGIVKWLLTTKQDEHWQTTKATAAVIDLLQKEKGGVFEETKTISTNIENQNLSVSDGLLDGMPVAFAPVKQLPQSLTVKQQGTNVRGDLTWYYFAEPSRLDTLNKVVHISKQFYSLDDHKAWVPLNPRTLLKAGDRVQVKLIMETAAALSFVHISDPRAAAFEPKESNSGYRYSDGFGYYQSIRDTGLDLFAESIPKGISTINYELVVAHDGEFNSGPAKLQCMYQPSLTAYSVTTQIRTN
jgi:uncharacterized protein YfaS (alpha-2-macroglobulin family)